MSQTVLIGMNNPLNARPEFALYPFPEGCTGWRIWQMLNEASVDAGHGPVDKRSYVRHFDRRNVLGSFEWNKVSAVVAGGVLRRNLRGRRAVVLGVKTLEALDLHHPRPEWGEWRSARDPLDFCLLPHPSGRSREYNDAKMRRLAGSILLEEFRRPVA